VEAEAFSRLHVFRYSARPGTPAAVMPGQVPAEVKASRSAALRALGDRLAAAYVAAQSGTVAELLVERMLVGPDGAQSAEGTTREYVRVTATGTDASAELRAGTLARVLIEPPADGGVVRGRIVG